MKHEISRAAMALEERRLRSRVAQLVDGAGLLHGSLVVRTRVCGKPGCRCATGEGHRALILTVRSKGRTEQIYVPASLEETVQRWVDQDRLLRGLLGELGVMHTQKLRDLKKRGTRSSDES
jgi:hypothetical protein